MASGEKETVDLWRPPRISVAAWEEHTQVSCEGLRTKGELLRNGEMVGCLGAQRKQPVSRGGS